MGRLRALTALAFGVVALVGAGAARADTPPNAWDKVKDPTLGERWELHLRVRQVLALVELERRVTIVDPRGVKRLYLDAALTELARAHAETGTDPILQNDLLDVYRARHEYLREERDSEMLPLAKALCADARLGDASRARACFTLALVYAKAERTEDEIAAYAFELPLESDPEQRAVVLMNRAEGYMRLGRLTEAIDGYREVISNASAIAGAGRTVASAYWGLAVALDRYRDPRGGLEAARFALMTDPALILVTPEINDEVFFVPKFDAHWYRAVGWRQKALSATAPGDVARYYGQSEIEYGLYVIEAERAGDTMYLPIARERLEVVKKLHAEALRRVPAKKATPSDLDL